MAGRSADLLAEAAVLGASPELVARLVRQLAADPPLALWAARSSAGRTLGALAPWLAAHAPAALAGQATSDPPDRFADLVAQSALAAEYYRARSPSDDLAASDGLVAALLHNSPNWLANSEVRSGNSKLKPATSDFRVPTSDFDPEPCRRRAEQVRSEWLAPGLLPDQMLDALAAKLARLTELEQRFDEVLQRAKLDSMAEFAAGAGHEINNPLAVIAGRAQLFLREEKDPERRRGLALINAQAMRVYEMIADLRLFARPPALERKRVELVGLVDRLIEELGARAAEQDTALRRVEAPDSLLLDADPAQLAVALKAMIANSLEALGGGGHVEVAIGRDRGEAWIRVGDDGPGIAPADMDHIFDPFFSARQAGRGLGMGLAKCWRIVTDHGGRVEAASQPGHGASFTIRLPSAD